LPALLRPAAVYAPQEGLDGGHPKSFEDLFLQATITEDFPGQFHEIQGPKPFDIGLGTDIIDDHPTDGLKLAPAFSVH
jgi:hypothetical protein